MVVRGSQIRQLENIYAAGGNSLVFISGRNTSEREGIFKLFLRDKKFFYYRARNASPEEQYKQMRAEVEKKFNEHLTRGTYNEIFNRIKSGDASKLVVVIDEAQHLRKDSDEFWQAIAQLRGKKLYPGPVMIIIYSSSLVWAGEAYKESMGETAKKIDYNIRLNPLKFSDVVRNFENLSLEEIVRIYATFGGCPDYLTRYNPAVDYKTNVCRLILNSFGSMNNEAERFIGSELRELAVYDTILAAIASGNSKLNDLYHTTGYSRAKISVYIKNLSEFGVVDKRVSVETGGWENTQKGLYEIKDTFVNFWFTFIYPNLSALYILSPEEFYDEYIATGLDAYLEKYFTDVCQEFLELMNKMEKLPINIKKIGGWIGKNAEINIIALEDAFRSIVGITCWRDEKRLLKNVTNMDKAFKDARIYPEKIFIFSAGEFSAEIKDIATSNKLIELVDIKQL